MASGAFRALKRVESTPPVSKINGTSLWACFNPTFVPFFTGKWQEKPFFFQLPLSFGCNVSTAVFVVSVKPGHGLSRSVAQPWQAGAHPGGGVADASVAKSPPRLPGPNETISFVSVLLIGGFDWFEGLKPVLEGKWNGKRLTSLANNTRPLMIGTMKMQQSSTIDKYPHRCGKRGTLRRGGEGTFDFQLATFAWTFSSARTQDNLVLPHSVFFDFAPFLQIQAAPICLFLVRHLRGQKTCRPIARKKDESSKGEHLKNRGGTFPS